MRKTKFWMTLVAIFLVTLSVAAVPASQQMGVWRDINPNAYISPPANPQLNSLFMISSNEGWAVGDTRPTTNTTTGLPAIFHYDGSTWNLVPAPKIPDFPSRPSAYNLTSVTFGAPNLVISKNDGWTVGFNSTIGAVAVPNSLALHWDGVTWRTQVAGLSGPNAGPLWSSFMVSSTDVWAVGQDQSNTKGVFWHWTGVAGLGGGWNMPQAPVSNPLYSVFMVSPTEGWAVGAGGVIFHYFGGSWNSFTSPVNTPLRSVFMISASEGWAVGDGGIIIHYSSGIWSGPVSPGTTLNNLFSIFMTASTDGWAFGAKGTILHYSGGSWTALPSNLVPTSPVNLINFNSAYFNGPNDGWAVGTDGVVVHFDGVNYGTVTSPTINNFTSISFGPPLTGPIDPNDGWAVGNASATPSFEPTVYHWNGFQWTKGVAIGTTNSLNSVFMVNSGDVWAVGGGKNHTASCSTSLCPIILHFLGGSWNSVTPPPGTYTIKSVFMVSSDEGWAVGEQFAPTIHGAVNSTGIILHYTVSGGVGTWAIFPSPTGPAPSGAIPPLNSVFMLGQNEGWAMGDNATILHYTVSGGVGTWNLVTVSGTPTLFPDANLTSVFMLSPTSGWGVGGIQANQSLSAGPVIVYWDGTKWEPVAAPSIPGGITPTGHTSALLKSVFFTAADDGWAVGYPGILVPVILHWDGISWRHVSLSPALVGEIPPILTSVYMTGEASGWIVGASPDFKPQTVPCDSNPDQYLCQAGPVGPYGYKTPLSTILRFSPFGGVLTATTTIVSTLYSSVTALTTQTSTSSSVTVPVSNITISIKVINNQGTTLQGVKVSIPSLGLSNVTNSQGLVSFSLPPGTYTVTFTQGVNSGTQSINPTTDGQTFTVTLNMSPGIPGFPVESIVAGVVGGMVALMLIRRRRKV